MAHLPASVRSECRFFAFYVGNRTLPTDIIGDFDYLDPSDPGLGSALEQAFAIFVNVLDVDVDGQVTNATAAQRRAAQYLRSYCDPSYIVAPPFEEWEVELA
jgi:hypothetical protein